MPRDQKEGTMTAVLFLLVVAGILIYFVWLAYNGAEPNPGEARPVTTVTRPVPTKTARDAQIVCPHCQAKGSVTTRHVKLKRGISGGKATGAILTAGLSILAVGLSRKEAATKATCSNCGSVWHF